MPNEKFAIYYEKEGYLYQRTYHSDLISNETDLKTDISKSKFDYAKSKGIIKKINSEIFSIVRTSSSTKNKIYIYHYNISNGKQINDTIIYIVNDIYK